MYFNRKLSAVVLGVVILSLAAPAFAEEKKEEMKKEEGMKKVEKGKPNVDGGLGTTNSGGTAACPTYIACVVNGVIVTGPPAEACNGGSAQVITQCDSKAKKP